MNALIKPLAAAAILAGAFLSAPALAVPSCATTIGMTITPPDGSQLSADVGECLDITGGFNRPWSGSSSAQEDAFKQLLADKWGGAASDWFYLNESGGRSDNISSGNFPEIGPSFDTWTNMQITPDVTEPLPTGGTAILSGSFTVSIIDDTSFSTPFQERRLDIVGVMKPDDMSNPGNANVPGSYVDSVFAYLFSDIVITRRGELGGTFDFRSTPGVAASTYAYAGNLGLFGRVVSTPVNPTPIPEPGILALIGVAVAGASMARRKRSL